MTHHRRVPHAQVDGDREPAGRTPRDPGAAGPGAGRPAAGSGAGSGARRPAPWRRGLTGEAGMTTAEYAVGTVAACGFGAVLYKAVTSDAVARLLRGVLEQALSVSFL